MTVLLPARTPAAWCAAHAAGGDADGALLRVDDLLADGLHAAHRRFVDDGEPPAAAAKYLVGYTAGAVAAAVGLALATADAGLLIDPASLAWRAHDDGWLELVTVRPAAVLVGPGHPWAGQATVTVTAEPLVTGTVDGLVATVDPLVTACSRLAKVGRRALWEEVADPLGAPVGHRLDVPAVPAVVETLAAAVAVPGAPWRTRPTVRIVDAELGRRRCGVYVVQKGGCCLSYTRAAPLEAGDDPGHAANLAAAPPPDGQPSYCSTCRFRAADDCTARQLWYLAREAAAGDG